MRNSMTSGIMCYVCKNGIDNDNNELQKCDVCNRKYKLIIFTNKYSFSKFKMEFDFLIIKYYSKIIKVLLLLLIIFLIYDLISEIMYKSDSLIYELFLVFYWIFFTYINYTISIKK